MCSKDRDSEVRNWKIVPDSGFARAFFFYFFSEYYLGESWLVVEAAVTALILNGDCNSCSALATKFWETELTWLVMNEKLLAKHSVTNEAIKSKTIQRQKRKFIVRKNCKICKIHKIRKILNFRL